MVEMAIKIAMLVRVIVNSSRRTKVVHLNKAPLLLAVTTAPMPLLRLLPPLPSLLMLVLALTTVVTRIAAPTRVIESIRMHEQLTPLH